MRPPRVSQPAPTKANAGSSAGAVSAPYSVALTPAVAATTHEAGRAVGCAPKSC